MTEHLWTQPDGARFYFALVNEQCPEVEYRHRRMTPDEYITLKIKERGDQDGFPGNSHPDRRHTVLAAEPPVPREVVEGLADACSSAMRIVELWCPALPTAACHEGEYQALHSMRKKFRKSLAAYLPYRQEKSPNTKES
jgi:hypothetical protein